MHTPTRLFGFKLLDEFWIWSAHCAVYQHRHSASRTIVMVFFWEIWEIVLINVPKKLVKDWFARTSCFNAKYQAIYVPAFHMIKPSNYRHLRESGLRYRRLGSVVQYNHTLKWDDWSKWGKYVYDNISTNQWHHGCWADDLHRLPHPSFQSTPLTLHHM